MKNVLFYSFKGGSGRSLSMCNVAAALCRRGYKVGLLDLDVEAPSLHIQLRDVLPADWSHTEVTPDILTLLTTDPTRLTKRAVDETLLALSLPSKVAGACFLMPCFGRHSVLDAIDRGMQDGWLGLVPALDELRKILCFEVGLDVLLLDSRTGYAAQSMLAAVTCEQAVVVTRSDAVSVDGVAAMLRTLSRKMEAVHLVLSSVPARVDSHDSRIQAFTHAIGWKSAGATHSGVQVLVPYTPDWYFEGGVIWQPTTQHQRAVAAPFDAVADAILDLT